MNVDTNRNGGPGAGGVSVTVNTITVAETMLPEYSSGAGKVLTFQVRPGYQFDPTSPVTALSEKIGLNGGAVNTVATIVPLGTADEVLTFNLTSGTDPNTQDIIRVNGIRLRIFDERGAAGPAQTTIGLGTATMGGAFTDQGIVATTIEKGAAQRLKFSTQPGTTQTGMDLLPSVTLVDFGGNIIASDTRTITLSLQANPGSATLLGMTSRDTVNGVATWVDTDNLNLVPAAVGYTLLAGHNGAPLLDTDTTESAPFEITAGAPDHLVITQQPATTAAGADILIDVSVFDAADNLVTSPSVDITLDPAVNPGGWPLLSANGLTKATVNGVASWGAADDLRITKAVEGYRLAASGVGATVFTDLFDIFAGSASLLAFVQQPTDTVEGVAIDPAVSVEITDEFLNRTNAAIQVQLELDPGSCTGTLVGGTDSSINGVATFAAVTIDEACTAAILNASSLGLTGAVSDVFEVASANVNENENANENGNGNANEDDGDMNMNGAQCGACGAGMSMAFLPLSLILGFARMVRSGRRSQG